MKTFLFLLCLLSFFPVTVGAQTENAAVLSVSHRQTGDKLTFDLYQYAPQGTATPKESGPTLLYAEVKTLEDGGYLLTFGNGAQRTFNKLHQITSNAGKPVPAKEMYLWVPKNGELMPGQKWKADPLELPFKNCMETHEFEVSTKAGTRNIVYKGASVTLDVIEVQMDGVWLSSCGAKGTASRKYVLSKDLDLTVETDIRNFDKAGAFTAGQRSALRRID